jgi:hypothetical protein
MRFRRLRTLPLMTTFACVAAFCLTATAAGNWPAAFPENDRVSAPLSRTRTKTAVLATGAFRITVTYPEGWTADVNATMTRRGLFMQRRRAAIHQFSVLQPVPALFDLRGPVPPALLDTYAERMRDQMPSTGGPNEIRGKGQIDLDGRQWLWTELLAYVPPDVPMAEYLAERMPMWIFATTEGNQAVAIVCTVIPVATATAEQTRAEVGVAASYFQDMLKHVVFGPIS